MRYNKKLFVNSKKHVFATLPVDMSNKIWIMVRYKIDGYKYHIPTKILINKTEVENYSHRV
jgi:hypothetical protein